ncbi:MAG TPA: cyclic nucleotide-binding domain-containing protein [Hyphomicrobium sp.]|nr:cyclic nucleotide-binding domain-containing protein [Hyphomicrobium sp.]
MAIDALVKPFLHLPLFQGLRPLQLTEIVRRADRIIYRPGDIIITEDQVGEAAIVIVSGEAVRLNGSESSDAAESVPEGSMIGELAMLVETIHSATILAKTTVKALRLTRTEMQDAMADDPKLADHLTQKISERLHRMAEELRSVDRALADLSAYEAHKHGASTYGYTPLSLH